MKTTLFLILCCLCQSVLGQRAKVMGMYQHHATIVNNDTINYHTYTKKGISSVNSILLYIQGSRARSLYQVKHVNGKERLKSAIPLSLKLLPDDYLLVVISKKGFPFIAEEHFEVPKVYFENQTLAYRANQANEVIIDLQQKFPNHFKNIIALGHSEGSDVIAKLGTLNRSITHFGYWAGGGNTQLLDFITFIRKEVIKGKLTEEQALIEIESVLTDLKRIMNDPDATDKFWQGKHNSYMRWSHFAEPPINNLLQINQPIFAAIGSKDQAVPVESAYLIPVEFIRHQKDNLTFKVYPNLDHGFGKQLEDGSFEDHWNRVFTEFLTWVDEH